MTKQRLADIVFEHNDSASKRFDLVLLLFILASVSVAIFDSIPELRQQYGKQFYILEWTFTGIFLCEYILRIWLSYNKRGYVFIFYGIIAIPTGIVTSEITLQGRQNDTSQIKCSTCRYSNIDPNANY
ncbi:MAG: ion transporter, partial [Schleiferiaceae bacterium]|nr:ion transporter [Schleiferiaceae bacterium]